MRRPAMAAAAALVLSLVFVHGKAATLAAQAPPASAAELADLRARADDSFADDDLESAIRLYRELAEKTVEPAAQVEILVVVAWVEFLAGRSPEAVDTLTEGLTRQGDMAFQEELYSEEFRRLFAIARTRAQTRREKLTYEHLRRGIDAMKARDYTAARQAFELALAKVPDHPQGLYNLALAHLYEGDREAAMAGFQKLISLATARPETVAEAMQALAWVNIGYLHNARQAYAEAEAALARAADLDPDNATAWVNLGSTRRSLGKIREAADAFRRAASLSPDDPTVIVNLGISYIDVQDWVSAAALLREATARFPVHGGLWLHLGRAQVGLGNPSLAIASFEQAIGNDPQNAGGWAAAASVELARAYYGSGSHEACLRAADQALAWTPERADALVYQGLARKALGNLDGARRSLEEARRLEPTLTEVHYNLGTVYLELGRTSDATAAFERALALDPGHGDARASLEGLRGGTGTTPAPPRRAPPPRSDPPAATAPPAATGVRFGVRWATIDYSAVGLRGALIDSVEADSAAGRADLRKNDLILKVDGRDVANADELERYLGQRPRGATVVLDVLRNNLPQRIEVTLR